MAPSDRRIDPADTQPYTFDEFFAWYRQQGIHPQHIQRQWALLKPLELRFKQGDRVLCNIGTRRLLGTVLQVDVEDPEDPQDERIAYVVKTDSSPGFPGTTISAPCDEDEVVLRERCFDTKSGADLTKWAAASTLTKTRKPLRFGTSDRVAIRVRDTADGYENWVVGRVLEIWPPLPGESDGCIPYMVKTDSAEMFRCHRDVHMLIRSPENIPRAPCKGVSKRFEHRKCPNGSMERFDHVTLKSRELQEDSTGDEE